MVKLPHLTGFGLWKVPSETAAQTVYDALKLGYRTLDGASDYGNEKEGGEGLARAIEEGLVTREEVFITSKLWNTNHSKAAAAEAVRNQLKNWGISYFDLYLIHFPISLEHVPVTVRSNPEWWDGTPGGKVTLDKTPLHETWAAMELIKEQGLAKEIGVSNFAGGLIVDLMRYARIPPAVLQIEHHPYLAQPALIRLCKTLNIAVTGYSSFGPQSFLEISHATALVTPSLLEHPVIVAIAKAHSCSSAQVLLRWSTQRGISVVPKSNDHDRAIQNLNHVKVELTKEDFEAIAGLDQGLRFNNPEGIDPRLAIFA